MTPSEAIIRDLYVNPLLESLHGSLRPPPALGIVSTAKAEESAAEKACSEWVEQREREAYLLAPWLKDELEAAESYY